MNGISLAFKLTLWLKNYPKILRLITTYFYKIYEGNMTEHFTEEVVNITIIRKTKEKKILET